MSDVNRTDECEVNMVVCVVNIGDGCDVNIGYECDVNMVVCDVNRIDECDVNIIDNLLC